MKKLNNLQAKIIIIFLSLLFCGTIGFLIQKNLTKIRLEPLKKISFLNVHINEFTYFYKSNSNTIDITVKIAENVKNLLEVEKSKIIYQDNCVITSIININNVMQINYSSDLKSEVIVKCNNKIEKIIEFYIKKNLSFLSLNILLDKINDKHKVYINNSKACEQSVLEFNDVLLNINKNLLHDAKYSHSKDMEKFYEKIIDNLFLFLKKLENNEFKCSGQIIYISDFINLIEELKSFLNKQKYANYDYIEVRQETNTNDSIKNKILIIFLSLILGFPLSVLLIKFYPYFRK
jgi:hypothetical protein